MLLPHPTPLNASVDCTPLSIPGMANGLWMSALRLSQSRSDLYRLRAFRLRMHFQSPRSKSFKSSQSRSLNQTKWVPLASYESYVSNFPISSEIISKNLLRPKCVRSQSQPDFHGSCAFPVCTFKFTLSSHCEPHFSHLSWFTITGRRFISIGALLYIDMQRFFMTRQLQTGNHFFVGAELDKDCILWHSRSY